MGFSYEGPDGQRVEVGGSEATFRLNEPLAGPSIAQPDLTRELEVTYTRLAAMCEFAEGDRVQIGGRVFQVTRVKRPKPGSRNAAVGMITYNVKAV